MAKHVLVEREDEALTALGHLSLRVSADVGAVLGLETGDTVRVETVRGRRVLGRVEAGLKADEGRGTVRLNRWQRQALKARLYETVEVEKVAELRPLTKLILHPAVHVLGFDFLTCTIQERLVGAPLTRGMMLYFQVRTGGGGMAFSVLEAEPAQGVMTADTEFRVEWDDHGHTHAPGQGHAGNDVTFEDVGGMDEVIETVRRMIQLPLQFPEVYRTLGITQPRGIILCGPPGVGKTHLARALASEIDAQFYSINGPEVIGTMHGETETNLRRIFSQAIAHSPAVVLIDELDAIAPKRDQAGSQSDVRMVTQLLSLMDGLQKVDGVMVVGTTNRIDAVDVALRRPGRFDRELYIRPPEASSRLDILKVHSREMPLSDEAVRLLEKIAERTHGFVGADLMDLCREAGLQSLQRLAEHGDLLDARRGAIHVQVQPEDFEVALRQVRPSALRETLVIRPGTKWGQIAGMEDLKQRLHDLVVLPFLRAGDLRAHGIQIPHGIILHGPHGTGKTMLAHASARAAGVNLIAMNGPEIFSKWLGESEEAIRHVFQLARQLAPCIVFIDHLDAMAPHRPMVADTRTAQRVVSQLLAELDTLDATQEQKIVVLAATDRLDLIDPAVLRAGRLGVHVAVDLPSEADRVQIARLYLEPHLKDACSLEETARRLASATPSYSGAELRALVEDARLRAFKRDGLTSGLSDVDLDDALARASHGAPAAS